jgi:hypothetical protein
MLQDCRFLQFVVSNLLVFCHEQPTLLANEGQPNSVLRAWAEVLAVAFVLHAMFGERIEDGLAVVKILVEIQNEVFRQRRLPSSAPSELLLQSAAA